MANNKRQTHEDRLATLKKRCLLFAGVLTEGSPFADAYFGAIEDTAKRGDIKGLEQIIRDFEEWAKGLSPEIRERLRSEMGRAPDDDLEASTLDLVTGILERGRINTNEEFRRLMAYVDGLLQQGGPQRRIDFINEMLSNYEETESRSPDIPGRSCCD